MFTSDVFCQSCRIAVLFARGILGLEDHATNTFCWLLAILFLLLCYKNLFPAPYRKLTGLFCHCWRKFSRKPREYDNQQLFTQAVLDNQRNEHFERNEPINRQLEAENRENENEENSIAEAVRARINLDNELNVQRERGSDMARARQENRQNVERQVQHTQIVLENRRNQTQERHRYFLRERNRGLYAEREMNL